MNFNFFLKKIAIFSFFLVDFEILWKNHFFSKKFNFSSIFVSWHRNEFYFKFYNFFFQWKLRSHSLHCQKSFGKRANILARFKLQRYAYEQKIRFSPSNPKNGAFQLALSRNTILTSESKRTSHFWSRTTLV